VHYYRAYGYQFASELPLPLLETSPVRDQDFQVHYAFQSDIKAASSENYRELFTDQNGWTLRYTSAKFDWVDYRYDNDTSQLTVATNLPWDDCIYPLVSVVFGTMMAHQNIPMLHGAGLSLQHKALILLGDSGFGKSTMAGAFVTRNAALLSDDLVRLSYKAGIPQVESGSSRLSLMTDAYDSLKKMGLNRPISGQRSDIDKYLIDAGGSNKQVNLAAIFILNKADKDQKTTVIQQLSASKAALALMHNRYGSDWLPTNSKNNLEFFTQLIKTTPVFTVSRPPGFAELMHSCAAIEDQIAER